MHKIQSESKTDYAELLLRAECGDAHAQHLIGMLLESGSHASPNTSAAWEWFRKAAEQGHAPAQMKLGVKCQRESRRTASGKMDEAKVEAYKWFKLAAVHGSKNAADSRDLMALNMTQEEVTEGNRRVAAFAAPKTTAPQD